MSALLPCPFCGSDGDVEIYDGRGTFVQCCGCYVRAESTEAWNTRTQPDPDQLLDQLAEALRDARRFIENGVELGYIAMPAPSLPDSAHNTLPNIRAALSAYDARRKP